jgi:hypothetical protein
LPRVSVSSRAVTSPSSASASRCIARIA